jgi:hypothetical protein
LDYFKYAIYLLIVNIEESVNIKSAINIEYPIINEIFNGLRKINDEFDITVN